MINCIQNKSFCVHNMCVYCVFFMYYIYIYIYINKDTHIQYYLENIYMLYLYNLYYYKHLIYKRNLKKIIYTHACVFIHNKYTQYTHIYYVHKNVYFGCD